MPLGEFRVETDPLKPETIKIAELELRETPERVAEATLKLRELLHADKSLYYRDDDEFLLIFLRPCKFYPESAIQLMKRIAEFRKVNADLLDGLMPIDIEEAFLNHSVINILKIRDHKGRRILVVNVGGTWDTKGVNADTLFKLFYLVHQAAILEPETQVRGCVVLMDFEGMGMSQVRGLTPNFSMRLLTFIQDAMPVRLKEVHFVREPWVFKLVWQLFKPMVRAKLRARMYFHKNDMKSLHKHMDPEFLPSNYGGSLPKIDYGSRDWYPVVNQHLDHVAKLNTYGYAKTEQPENAKK